ncbi:MAG: 3-phosphoshikimate 1-carboxyvinyltransferase [Desulfobacterales bacterium]|nr:3-phosphoshikimate 1-carboxyvinyltransferase [Desulfobacterales bacterium]MDD3951280.1 3-phosphoshikimate 1-carboxyvinyltransferase [Desulfobacterales bacterium]MDD4463429.1 3-phosphoshikimate 1-carboxyvinyltransferase [Desulfobacterales bacterium]
MPVDMKIIQGPVRARTEVCVPGSKSFTHRVLIAAALSDGICDVCNPLLSEDTLLTINALKRMGVRIEACENSLKVFGTGGRLAPCTEPIYLGNSGTSMRLLAAVAALGKGDYQFYGTERMHQRPIADLLDALNQIKVQACSVDNTGRPPIIITGGSAIGGTVRIDCRKSSQYLSALLLIAPYTRCGMEIFTQGRVVSRPYIDLTVDVMERFGVRVQRNGYESFKVSPVQVYRTGTCTVEPDASQAGYFWAAAAITGACIAVKGLNRQSRQGDLRFTEVLENMGCRILENSESIEVCGRAVRAVNVDMGDMPDLVPTLAVVAAFAEGVTIIRNVGHLKEKESNRLAAVVAELSRMGIDASCTDSELRIAGGKPSGALIHTYNDHRMAMSFALAGLQTPGIVIENKECVVKSFPNFWHVFESLYDLV